ncbi:hypothetical protein PAP_09960 [Palaeococcus pacificus DY20341]|uniref:KaiC-like domain-containing protein n=1 Tax=Palaeococcus pacificus DY20341 TaxID=1343739 RepID=A0A075LVY7_9EURY|nr:hypothetical protein [Palaeococcus pacificus]AIF70366.1 hypothetical protein PAP_09960 [Palaeococcus pacificus DY20341]
MQILSTGIEKLDNALGGGLLEDSVTLIVYDTYSLGWGLAIKILENRIKNGDFGVIINSVLPLSSLATELGMTGFNIYKCAESGDLGIIDIFASVNKITYPYPFIYSAEEMDVSTFLPKYANLYRRMLKERIKDRRPVGVTITMDGSAFLFGEDQVIKILQRNLTLKETARMTETRKRPLNIMLLNRDRVSRKFISWIALYSQYIIEFQSSEGSETEKMVVRKSPLPNFDPQAYEFRLRGGSIRIL